MNSGTVDSSTDVNIELESNVRSYSRLFTTTYDRALGSWLFTASGERHLDFLAGCGAMNYGHNHPLLKQALVDYVNRDGLAMSLDMHSCARASFVETFHRVILDQRNLKYRLQFPGPTGTNCVEAAIKLARKVTGRTNVVAFTNAFHGCSIGALSLTGSRLHRSSSSSLLNQTTRIPYNNYFGPEINTADVLARMLDDPSSGVDAPAAIIVELVQGEGGLQVASADWLKQVEEIASDHGALLIVDDIQAGCGRTGSFFSFEPFGMTPDIVCMAKGISGFGLPMSLMLIKHELDHWSPGEHNGTFRGNNHAFVTAAAALDHFWRTSHFQEHLQSVCAILFDRCSACASAHGLRVKGRGAMLGLEFNDADEAQRIQAQCIAQGLVVERCGPRDEVLKILPPLTIAADEIETGFSIIERSVEMLRSRDMNREIKKIQYS